MHKHKHPLWPAFLPPGLLPGFRLGYAGSLTGRKPVSLPKRRTGRSRARQSIKLPQKFS
jgi:hypothetical protein